MYSSIYIDKFNSNSIMKIHTFIIRHTKISAIQQKTHNDLMLKRREKKIMIYDTGYLIIMDIPTNKK